MTDILSRLRGDIPHRLIEDHWTVDFEALDAEREEAAEEIELLRHALGLCQTQLFKALYYHGYPDHGPLSEPATIVAIDSAKYALEGK
jgi:hypothetical protein